MKRTPAPHFLRHARVVLSKKVAPLLALAALLAACASEPPPPEPPLRPVRIQQVISSGAQRIRSFSGVAQANVESALSFRVSGYLRRMLVEVGDSVTEHQLIAELDPTDYELQVQEAEAALAQAQAQARRAEADYERMRGLYENRNAAKSDLDAARAAAESARAQIDASIKRLEQARAQLSYTALRAPTAGAIASVSVEINENLRAGQEVAMLTAGALPEVNVALPESLIGQVRHGSEVSVVFDALAGRSFPGRITKVGVAAVGTATTYPVTVQLSVPSAEVRSGMTANVRFTFGTAAGRSRFVVPPQAVLEDRQGRFVFVVEPSSPGVGIVHRKAVQIGELTGEGLEIDQGLSDGDRLVIAGVSQIEDGLQVRLARDDGSGP